MSQLIQHYQTSFVIKNETQSAANKLFQAQYVIGEWIKSKENGRYRKMGRDSRCSFLLASADFKHRASYRSKYSWCRTNFCKADDSSSWAVEYTHRDASVKDVYWVSEIGFRAFENSGDLVVSVKISYKVSTEYSFRGIPYSPEVTIPWCVEALVDSFSDSHFYSGGQDVTAGIGSPVLVSEEGLAQRIQRYISDPERKLAVVLLCGETPQVKEEAAFYSKNLFAKALVFIVPCNAMRRHLRVRLDLNECLFIPSFRLFDSAVTDRLHYKVTDPACMDERHKVLLRSWLGVHAINEYGSVVSLEGIAYLIRQQMLIRFEEQMKGLVPVKDYEDLKRDLHEISGLFDLSEQENKELRKERKELKDKAEKLEDNNRKLEDLHRQEIHSMSQVYLGQMRRRTTSRHIPRNLPLTVESLKKWSSWFENLLIPEKAWNGLTKRKHEDFIKIAWDMLWGLDQKVFPFYHGGQAGDPKTMIENSTGYSFSSHESETTQNCNDWANERVAVVNGREIPCFKHLRRGTGASTAMRVYFEYVPDWAKIVVAHIGEHLTTKGTART